MTGKRTVRFRLNVGDSDARSVGLKDAIEGNVIDLDAETADQVVSFGWAEVVDDGDGLAETQDESGPHETQASSLVDLKAVPPMELQADEPGEGDDSDDNTGDSINGSKNNNESGDFNTPPPRRGPGRPRSRSRQDTT